MDLALKFGNVDALISKAIESMKIGDSQNCYKTVILASQGISDIKNADTAKRCSGEIQKRQNALSDMIFKMKQGSVLQKPQVEMKTEVYGVNLDEIVVEADNSVFLEDIIGLDEVKIILLQAILFPVAIPDFVKSEQRWRGILLFGSSGVGKTKIIRALNNSIKKTTDEKITFLELTLDKVLGAFHGDTEKQLTAIFKAAARKAPVVITINEIDSLCSTRSSDKQQSETKIINHFLALLDELSKEIDIVLLGTTNKADGIDIAFYRRFQKMLYFELPNLDQRERLLESLVGKFQATSSIDFRSLAASTERFSSADLTRLVAEAVNVVRGKRLGWECLQKMEASENFNVKDFLVATDYRSITEVDLRNAMKSISPTNTEAEIRRLDKFAESFCGRQQNYTRVKSDIRLPKAKMVLKKPGKSALMIVSFIHQFFGNGV